MPESAVVVTDSCMGFKSIVLCELHDLGKKVSNMSEAVDQFVEATTASLNSISGSLANIAADEAALAAQIAELLSSDGISGEALEKLTIIRNRAQALADQTKGIADSVPDPIPPPA